ncbi:hypothetical protein SH139x_000849 [Planctomycetaceae bacterium SH139]
MVSESADDSLVRIDISAQAWNGPPEGTVGWWKSRMPEAGQRKLKLAPDALLVDLLKQSEPPPSACPQLPASQIHLAELEDLPEEELPGEEIPEGESATGESASDYLADEHDETLQLDPQVRYLLALTLLRRRALRQLDSQPELASQGDSSLADANEQSSAHDLTPGQQTIALEVIADGTIVNVDPQPISAKELAKISDQLAELLYCEAD